MGLYLFQVYSNKILTYCVLNKLWVAIIIPPLRTGCEKSFSVQIPSFVSPEQRLLYEGFCLAASRKRRLITFSVYGVWALLTWLIFIGASINIFPGESLSRTSWIKQCYSYGQCCGPLLTQVLKIIQHIRQVLTNKRVRWPRWGSSSCPRTPEIHGFLSSLHIASCG